MNKAFIREPDRSGQAHCPRRGSLGLPVSREILDAFLLPEALAAVAESANDRKFNPAAIPPRRAEAPGAAAEVVAHCA